MLIAAAAALGTKVMTLGVSQSYLPELAAILPLGPPGNNERGRRHQR
jgi:hypothetical protein